MAVEITGNTRLFHDAVAPHVARVVVVDTNQFRVISQSVKKTDPHDARLLSLYLSKNMLPEVRMKDKEHGATGEPDADAGHAGEAAHARSRTRSTTFCRARGLNLPKEALSSEKRAQRSGCDCPLTRSCGSSCG